MAQRQPKNIEENKGNVIEDSSPGTEVLKDDEDSEDEFNLQYDTRSEPTPAFLTVKMTRALIRRLTDSAREEGVSPEELAAELISEGVVLRAWEIVEKKATMRGGSQQGQNFNRPNSNNNGNVAQNQNNHNHQRPFQGGNKMAQKKLQRQARQHANAMDLMADKAAFLEYVRNQEKKRR